MKAFLVSIALILVSVLVLNGQFHSLPLENQPVNPLTDYSDDRLSTALSRKLSENSYWEKLITNKKMSVALVDMEDPCHPRFASVNGQEMMYAASLPKIAILLAAMDALECGELDLTPEVERDMRLMISKSSNQAATRMIDRLGFEKIEEVLTNPQYRLYDESQGGGLWVGKRYASSGKRYPDPMKGLSHAATANQVARFYFKLVHGQLVSPEKSAMMLRIMEGPELHHKFVNTLRRVAPDASIFRKSGSWRTYHADSALVWEESGRRYILVALIDDPQGETICRQLVSVVQEILPLRQKSTADYLQKMNGE